MGVGIVIGLGASALAFALVLTLLGIASLAGFRRRAAAPAPLRIRLEGQGEFVPEPGVLLNILWEHLPDAACQSGECGGCKLRLLEGEVEWIREPIAEIDRKTHFLACSCQPKGTLRCAAG